MRGQPTRIEPRTYSPVTLGPPNRQQSAAKALGTQLDSLGIGGSNQATWVPTQENTHPPSLCSRLASRRDHLHCGLALFWLSSWLQIPSCYWFAGSLRRLTPAPPASEYLPFADCCKLDVLAQKGTFSSGKRATSRAEPCPALHLSSLPACSLAEEIKHKLEEHQWRRRRREGDGKREDKD